MNKLQTGLVISVALAAAFSIGFVVGDEGNADQPSTTSEGNQSAELRVAQLESENERLRLMLNNSRETNRQYRKSAYNATSDMVMMVKLQRRTPNITDADGDGYRDNVEIYRNSDPFNEDDLPPMNETATTTEEMSG